jgi:hypothetical protein
LQFTKEVAKVTVEDKEVEQETVSYTGTDIGSIEK